MVNPQNENKSENTENNDTSNNNSSDNNRENNDKMKEETIESKNENNKKESQVVNDMTAPTIAPLPENDMNDGSSIEGSSEYETEYETDMDDENNDNEERKEDNNNNNNNNNVKNKEEQTDDGCMSPGMVKVNQLMKKDLKFIGVDSNQNPLGDEPNNPWKTYYEDWEMWIKIEKDINRTHQVIFKYITLCI